MSLQLIMGGSGSGKSRWLYDSVIKAAMRHPERKYIVIVPEQYTMQTQRELVRLHPAHGILNIDILSFQRLAYRVFEETGAMQRTVLTETGKNLLLRKVAADKREELKILGSRLDKPGYISEMKSILSELTQYEISPRELEEMIRLSERRPQLQYKLKDIQVLYQSFRDYREGKFLTAEELLDVFCQAAGNSAMLKNSVLAFDGFTGFTPVQMKALEQLFMLSSEIRVTVTLGAGEKPEGKFEEHELFYLSKKTIRGLLQLAKETGTELLEPVMLTGDPGRFQKGSGLEFLERHLFRYGKNRWVHPAMDCGIKICEAANPMEEVEFAARRIIELVREQGYRYREIGVIAGDLPSYGNYVRKIFGEYEIPCFVDQTVQVLLNPCLEFIRGAFGVAEFNFSYESMFRFLRTGYAGLSGEETDRLENYVLAFGIRGRSRWEKEWTEKTERMAAEEAAVCEEYRRRIMEYLIPFLEVFGKGKRLLKEYASALYELLVSCRIQEQLKQQEERFRQQGIMDKVNEYSQIYGILIRLLDEAVELLGEETVARKEFEDILEAGFAEARVGIVPPGIDEVHVGDLERTRLNHIRTLFFLGLNDGWVPAKEAKGSIVSDLEREFLQEAGLELAPTARENSYIQRFYLYLGLTKPHEQLYLSYSRSSSQGAALRPSYLIHNIRKLFPGLKIEDAAVAAFKERIISEKTGLAVLAEGLRQMREDGGSVDTECQGEGLREVAENVNAEHLAEAKTQEAGDSAGRRAQASDLEELLLWYLKQPEYRKTAQELVEAAFLVLGENGLERRTARELYGEVLENSVTRLEEFASCAFAHFAAYGLQLKEREIYQVRSADIGNIFHRALELFARKLERSDYNWFNLPDGVRDKLSEECVKETVEAYGSRIFYDSERNRYLIRRMKRILKRSVWALHEQVRAGRFVPSSFEVSFLAAGDLDSVNIALSESEKMRLKGRIDRIDVCEEEDQVYVKVIDYKSGNTSFDLVALYYGLQLQLVVYLNAAMELEGRIHPDKRIVPAGIFYYHLQDPLPEGSHEQTPEEINEEILKKLRPSGLVNDDPAVVERLDAGFSRASRVIPVTRKADGSWSAASSVADTGQMEALSGFVQQKLKNLGREILKGEIQVNPYKRKQKTSCDYCVFSDLCGFDPRLPGAGYRQLGELPDPEIWKRIAGGWEKKE